VTIPIFEAPGSMTISTSHPEDVDIGSKMLSSISVIYDIG
jgi:hypothetical protein